MRADERFPVSDAKDAAASFATALSLLLVKPGRRCVLSDELAYARRL